MNWTEDQQAVIELRDRDILVSAAAGSGKTAVLVERIIEKITDKEKPVDIDRLLVVTFTKAAAAEMRTRIGDALEDRMLKEPSDKQIGKQLSLLHSAQISTIDSFCQWILKNYFHVIGIDPVYRIADETELGLLKSEVLEELLEERYRRAREEEDTGFLAFTEFFSTGRTDRDMETVILNLYEKSTSMPWPEEWIRECGKRYVFESADDLEQAEFMQELLCYIRESISEFADRARCARALCEEPDGPAGYLPAIESDLQFLEKCEAAEGYEEFQELLCRFEPERLKAVRGKEVSEYKKNEVKNLREEYLKKGILTLREKFFFQDIGFMLSDMQGVAPYVQKLCELALDFMQAFQDRKAEEGILDFSDLEHYALQILVERDEDGEVKKSRTAMELQEYYDEIMIDEYQDSNEVQELILGSISGGSGSTPTLFMVGDVKQSIYKFRMAKPEIFIGKYKRFTPGHGPEQKIDLHRNFRSRAGVTESVNFFFKRLMKEELGGIEYDEAAALVTGASFPDCGERTAGKTEVLLIERKGEDEEENPDKTELEAAVIGRKIKELVQGEDPAYVLGKNGYKKAEYRDIVILLRSVAGAGEHYIEVLNDMGIPAYADTKTGYFSSLEVQTVLNYLHIIDNPRQDIPLVAVLRSCIGNLTDEELAELGTRHRQLDFWDQVLDYAGEYESDENREVSREHFSGKEIREKGLTDPEQEKFTGEKENPGQKVLMEKLTKFLDRLSDYREYAKTHSVYELLQRIYEETGYYHYMAAMPSGEKRRANLDILLQQSVEFAANGHQGIYGFTRYIENLRKSDVDFGEASVISENTNAVRIMTIHKSKGLEFPVVFVAGMGKQFNYMDIRRKTLFDESYGVGCDYMDEMLRVCQPTLLKQFISHKMRLGILEEEIRVLYVALTRAKEKLYISGSASNLKGKLETWNRIAGTLDGYQLGMANTYLDWLVPALLTESGLKGQLDRVLAGIGDGALEHETMDVPLFQVELLTGSYVLLKEEQQLLEETGDYARLQAVSPDTVYNEELHALMKLQEEYRYPYEGEAELPVKISVTELKRQAALRAGEMEEEPEPEKPAQMESEDAMVFPEQKEIPIPEFLREKEEISGAARGTLYHLVMEHFPYQEMEKDEREWGETEFREYLCTMERTGYLSGQERELLDCKKFVRFRKSGIGKRMAQASTEKRLRLEQPFMIGIPAKEIYEGENSETTIIVQGIIDAFFFEVSAEGEEKIVLIDYKTDFVKYGDEDKLKEKYRAQLDYYARALERLTGRQVAEKIIYSFSLGKELAL